MESLKKAGCRNLKSQQLECPNGSIPRLPVIRFKLSDDLVWDMAFDEYLKRTREESETTIFSIAFQKGSNEFPTMLLARQNVHFDKLNNRVGFCRLHLKNAMNRLKAFELMIDD